jgi:hypothetical protein
MGLRFGFGLMEPTRWVRYRLVSLDLYLACKAKTLIVFHGAITAPLAKREKGHHRASLEKNKLHKKITPKIGVKN